MDKKQAILVDEVQSAIKRLKSNKSSGTGNVTGEMIKYGGDKLKKKIHSLCNRVWKEKGPKRAGKKSILVLIYKGSGLDCNRYLR